MRLKQVRFSCESQYPVIGLLYNRCKLIEQDGTQESYNSS